MQTDGFSLLPEFKYSNPYQVCLRQLGWIVTLPLPSAFHQRTHVAAIWLPCFPIASNCLQFGNQAPPSDVHSTNGFAAERLSGGEKKPGVVWHEETNKLQPN